MANRRPQNGGGRRMDFGRNDRGKNFGRAGVSPWQVGGPSGGLPNLLPLAGGSTEATLALASNIINLLQPRQNPVPSLLDMPIRRDFGPNMGRFDRGFVPNRMGNQNFRRTGNYNRAGERINNMNRRPFRPNDGPRQQNKSSPKKESDSKAKPVKESDEVKKEPEEGGSEAKEGTEEKKEGPKTRYDEINSQLLKCHICNKSMWDGRSFENHLSGRAHAIMMQKTAESYALTADTMRQEFKIREMKRTRKIGQQPARDFYCAMCDMYAGDGAVHRTTVGHRKLKKYLHPTCTSCHKEMPTRIELDEHRLTAEHLKNIQDKQEVVSKPKPEVMVISTLNMEQSYLRNERHRRWRDDREKRDNKQQEKGTEASSENQDEVKVKQEESEAEATETTDKPEEKKPSLDSENTILDYTEGDDLTGVTQEQFPVYSMERGVGRSFLGEFRCFQCKLCNKLLDNEETADVHLRTWRHHQLFQRLLADKSGLAQQQTQEAPKRAINSEETGNWKRRKTNQDGDDANGHGDDGEDADGEEADGEGEGDVSMKEKPEEDTEAEAEAGEAAEEATAEGENMPPADELEDWEQTVDEILNDEQNGAECEDNDGEEIEEENEPDKKAPSTPVAKASPTSAAKESPVKSSPAKATATPVAKLSPAAAAKPTPRGRGRGRRRY